MDSIVLTHNIQAVRQHGEIKIDAEPQYLIPALDRYDRAGLEESIRRDGCREPLVQCNGILLDGHHHLKICRAHGIEFKIATIDLPSCEHANFWIRVNQLSQRNLADDVRAIIVDEVREVGGPQPLGLPRFNSEFVIHARRNRRPSCQRRNFLPAFRRIAARLSEKPEEF
jgi:hypothetical protein